MDEKQLETFRQLLLTKLEELAREAGQQIGGLVEEREALSDAVDIASEESSREFALRVHEHDVQLAKEIRLALQRIDQGDYGICMGCGEEIAVKRLLARPMATHCIECKTEAEAKDRSSVTRFTNFDA